MNSGSKHRGAIRLLALLGMLLAVAVASTGSVPVGSGGTRPPSHRFVDVMVSLFLVWMVFGTILLVLLLINRKGMLGQAVAQRKRGRRRDAVIAAAVGFGLLALFIRWIWGNSERGQTIFDRLRPGSRRADLEAPGVAPRYEPEFATGPVLIVLGLLAVAIVMWAVAYRARRRSMPDLPESVIPALSALLDETLDDLRAETDPRRAVIAAYARMEQALAAYGLPRTASEAPDEYLQRIFADLEVSRRAVSRLTALFAWAKFSGHDVAPKMKDDAIEALEAVRNELRAAEILAEERRIAAAAELRERAWS